MVSQSLVEWVSLSAGRYTDQTDPSHCLDYAKDKAAPIAIKMPKLCISFCLSLLGSIFVLIQGVKPTELLKPCP